jgi:low temperature requirement protein LtrA
MLASLLMSVAIPEAFGERGLMFALAFVAIQVGRTAFAVLALYGASHPLSGTFWRILTWLVAAGVLWVAGGLVEGGARYVLWLLALAVDYAGPVMRYMTPGLGSSRTEEWTIEGTHFAERCQLFIIIALGESILVTGTTFGEIEASAVTVCAFVVAFVGSVALWWIYFARSAEAAREVFTSSEDPGRLGRSAYTYFHLPMVAGIIAVAAADELTVAHPGEPGTLASITLTLGGTALFLAGHALFKWAVFGVLPWSRSRGRRADGLDTRGLRDADARAQRRSRPDRGRSCGVGCLSLWKHALTTSGHVSTGRSPPSSTGGYSPNPVSRDIHPTS